MKIMIKNLPRFIVGSLLVTVACVFMIVYVCMGMPERAGIILVAVGITIGGYFATGYAIPLKYDDKVIRYKRTAYNWRDVKVTLALTHERFSSSSFVYNLAFGDRFMFGDDARYSVNSGFWVSLSITNLKIITQHYQDRIAVVNRDGSSTSVDKLLIDKRFKEIINEHNNKYFDKIKEENQLDQRA